ncbi:MAG: hypothetical protein AAGC55_14825, partial [Myxococcota bacterium]
MTGHADDTDLDINRFHPALGAQKILTTGLAEVGPQWQLVPQLFLHFADKPMVLTIADEETADVVRNRLTGELGVSLVLHERLELGLSFPVTLMQDGDSLALGTYY